MNILKSNPKDIIINDLLNSKKIISKGKTKIMFDQPYHLYLDELQSSAYIEMINADNFSTLLHDPALKLVEKFKSKILKDFKDKLSFYDLGPGFPTKTIPLLTQLKENNIEFTYYPVDVSKNFLQITESEINKIGIKSEKINCLFEDLSQITEKDDYEKLFFIGLTFNNYRPDEILSLFKKLANGNGTCLIITEYFRKKNIETILFPYKDKYAENFNYLSLKLAGIEKERLKYFTFFRNQRIEMGFIFLEDTYISEKLTIKKDTEIITAISYRYTKNILIKHILKHFSSFEFFEHNEKDVSLVAIKLSN